MFPVLLVRRPSHGPAVDAFYVTIPKLEEEVELKIAGKEKP